MAPLVLGYWAMRGVSKTIENIAYFLLTVRWTRLGKIQQWTVPVQNRASNLATHF